MTEEIMNTCKYYENGICSCTIIKSGCYCKKIDCIFKQLKRLEQENRQMKSALEEIKNILNNLGVCKNGVNGNCRPIRNTKKEDCYNAICKVKGIINEVLQ